MANQRRWSLRQSELKRFEVEANDESSDEWRNDKMQSCTSSGKSMNDGDVVEDDDEDGIIFSIFDLWV